MCAGVSDSGNCVAVAASFPHSKAGFICLVACGLRFKHSLGLSCSGFSGRGSCNVSNGVL